MTRPWRALALVATCGALAATAGCGGSEDGPEAASASAATAIAAAGGGGARSPDTLSNPQISLVPLGREFAIAANDNWGGAIALQDAFARAGAFNLSAGSLDAAVLVRLPPGGYTVVVSGVGGAVGTALVEVYDLDR